MSDVICCNDSVNITNTKMKLISELTLFASCSLGACEQLLMTAGQ